jgi:23S rRNA (adenine2503-C2)-methyltransferase
MTFQVKRFDSSDTNVAKYVFSNDDAVVEAVLYKYPTYEERTVICCSTMSGCPVGCRFCGTGDYYVRNMKADEIVFQVDSMLFDKNIDASQIQRFQIMFMSMGEPMLNFKELEKAIRILNEKYPQAALLISTSAPDVSYDAVNRLSAEIDKVGLQFSVHESTDEARNKLVPFKAKLDLAGIAAKGEDWFMASGRKPFFNYCAHEHNVSDADVERLRALFDPAVWECTISVVCERDESVAAANARQEQLAADFAQKMLAQGYGVRTFNPAGQDDIGGGCGQLWFVQDWMAKNPEKAKRSVGFGLDKVHTPAANCA